MKSSKEKLGEQKTENILVIISMIAIVVLVFVVFGWASIKSWISSPLIWKGQDSLEVFYLGTLPSDNAGKDYTLFLELRNNTKKEIDEYNITVKVEDIEFDCSNYSHSDISSSGLTSVKQTITTSEYPGTTKTKVSEETLEKLLNTKSAENIKVSWRIKDLKSDDETLVKNTGIYKNIIIVILSFATGIIGFFGNVKKAWLRILLKLLSIPAILVAIALLLLKVYADYSNSPEGKAALEKSEKEYEAKRKTKAANEYRYAAQTKAAATARGDYKTAAYAQERMDKSAADMISGGGSNVDAYKRAAHTKAAATVRGDHKTAAYAQAEMDKSMADILKNK